MGKGMVILIIATTLLLGCTNLGLAYYGMEPNQYSDQIHVGGKVLCQDCTQGWNEWIRGASPVKGKSNGRGSALYHHPLIGVSLMRVHADQRFDDFQYCIINGSVVAITCMDERNRIVRYARDETDAYGQFEFAVNMTCGGSGSGKRIKAEWCRARLVSSPDPSCNVLTNFGGGLGGVSLGRPSYVYRDTVKYTLQPFYFTSPMCEKPDLGDEIDENKGNDQGHY